MRKGGKRGFPLAFVLGLIVVLLTGGAQYFLWNMHFNKTTSEYEKQAEAMQATIDNIGPMVNVFTLVAEGTAGAEILQENLQPAQIPSSYVGGSYILDPAEVVGKLYKIDVKVGTPLTQDLVMEMPIDNTTREVDMTAMMWPVGLKVGDYVDFELVYPMGEVYTVISHIRVMSINQSTIKAQLNGVERHLYNGSLVDYFLNFRNGATLQMTKYVEPGVQEPATVYYAVPQNILAIITADPNIINKISAAVNAQRRALIDTATANITDALGGAISAGRMDTINKNNSATSAFLTEEKERKEQEAYDAAEAAGAYVPPETPVVPGDVLNVGEGVVE